MQTSKLCLALAAALLSPVAALAWEVPETSAAANRETVTFWELSDQTYTTTGCGRSGCRNPKFEISLLAKDSADGQAVRAGIIGIQGEETAQRVRGVGNGYSLYKVTVLHEGEFRVFADVDGVRHEDPAGRYFMSSDIAWWTTPRFPVDHKGGSSKCTTAGEPVFYGQISLFNFLTYEKSVEVVYTSDHRQTWQTAPATWSRNYTSLIETWSFAIPAPEASAVLYFVRYTVNGVTFTSPSREDIDRNALHMVAGIPHQCD